MRYLIGAAVTVAVLWFSLLLAVVLWRPKHVGLADAARLVPDVVVMLRGLARDPSVPRHVRWRIWLLLAWIISPIDLIPDLIPVIGFADDVALAYWVLRSVVRASGDEVLARHWKGAPAGLALVKRLAGRGDQR